MTTHTRKGELSPLLDKLRTSSFEKDSKTLGTLTEQEIIRIINTTHGIRYNPGTTARSMFKLLVDAGWLEYCGKDSYQLNTRYVVELQK